MNQPADDRPTLRRGSTGDAVRRLQTALTAAGFDPGPVDGIFGSRTDGAVRAFQGARGLAVDGIVGPLTWAALLDTPVPPSGSGHRARSLHIGLNFVNDAAYGRPVPRLAGCVNDANYMASMAAGQGFASSVLLNEQATVDGVTRAVLDAAGELAAGDMFLLSYSGHGSQVADLPGGDEADARDETWVLYDRQFLDDEIAALEARFAPGVRICLVSDSCHSGTVARRFPDAYADGPTGGFVPPWISETVSSAVRPAMASLARETLSLFRTVGADDDQAGRSMDGDTYTRLVTGVLPEVMATALPMLSHAATTATSRATTPSEVRRLPDEVAMWDNIQRRDIYAQAKADAADTDVTASVLLLSGCQDNQLSLDGRTNGLFTQWLRTIWNEGGFTGDYRDLHAQILENMPPTQSPNYYLVGAPNPAFEAEKPFTP